MVQALAPARGPISHTMPQAARRAASGEGKPESGRPPPRHPLGVAMRRADDAAPARKAKAAFHQQGDPHAE